MGDTVSLRSATQLRLQRNVYKDLLKSASTTKVRLRYLNPLVLTDKFCFVTEQGTGMA